jgi:hypothetical protein
VLTEQIAPSEKEEAFIGSRFVTFSSGLTYMDGRRKTYAQRYGQSHHRTPLLTGRGNVTGQNV